MPHFIFIHQTSVLNILNILYNLHFFSPSKCRLFHNATLFGFCITHILNTGCAKIWKKVRRQKVKVLPALLLNDQIFWNVTLCRCANGSRHFGSKPWNLVKRVRVSVDGRTDGRCSKKAFPTSGISNFPLFSRERQGKQNSRGCVIL